MTRAEQAAFRTPFDNDDIIRMGTDCEYINDLIAQAVEREEPK